MTEPLTDKELKEFKRTAEGMHDRVVLRLLATIDALETRVGALEGALKACKFTQHCQGCEQARAVLAPAKGGE